jgi:type I restriction enzyme S subunit
LPDGYPVFGANGIIGFYNEFHYHDEQILISCRGANSGTINTSPKQCFVTNNSLVLELPDCMREARRFLTYALILCDKSHMVSGSAQPQVTIANAEQVTLRLAPLPEQRRIAAKIDGLVAKSKRAREQLGRITRLVEKYKQAILAAAFRGKLTGDVGGFDRRSLGTLASLITKGASPKWQGFEYVEHGTLFIRSQNVGWGKLLLDDRAYLPPKFEKKHRRSVIHNGDILLNIVGASIGRSAVATSELEGANCNQAVSIIRILDGEATPHFLCYWLLSEEAQSAIWFGTVDFARANFSLGDIRDLRVPWPNAARRTEIVQRIQRAFDWIDRLASEASSARKLIDHLDKAVLAKAFRGELVPQDPNDEPASALLDRIKAEREATLPSRGRRGAARLL